MNRSALIRLLETHGSPKRTALSSRLPFLKGPIVRVRILLKKIQNTARFNIARKKSRTLFPHVIARHQSVLIRKLGNSDIELQKNKIENLRRACQDLNGLIIEPGQVFSLWETIGNPTYKRGYVDGMLLSNGSVSKGVGGGLCQLSNFLCWIFLHTNSEIVERYHHSRDVFPDSGRVLPFGSGATCLYNFVDFKVRNTGDYPLQIKIQVTDTHLEGQILSPEQSRIKFSVEEREHTFIKEGSDYFRYNEILQIAKLEGEKIWEKKIFVNFAKVLYEVTDDYLQKHAYPLVDLTKKRVSKNKIPRLE